MAYATSPGHPQYTGNFIPEIWSGKLIENFYDATVLAAISNTAYEGEIRSMGDTVNIRTTPEITIQTYVKGQTLNVEQPDKPKLQLLIDKGEYFACIEDDVDEVQPRNARRRVGAARRVEDQGLAVHARELEELREREVLLPPDVTRVHAHEVVGVHDRVDQPV